MNKVCDWNECNEEAIKRVGGDTNLCEKHLIEGGFIKTMTKNEIFRERLHLAISNIKKKYGNKIKEASWSGIQDTILREG